MMIRSRLLSFAVTAALLSSIAAAPLRAANVDIGAGANGTPLLTNTARVATGAAINSLNQANSSWRGVVCTWATTASSGSTSSVFGIQGYDTATNTYTTLKQSAAILSGPGASGEALNTPHTVAVVLGTAVSSLPTNYEAQNVAVPALWRVFETITAGGGSNPAPAVSSKIGCNYIQ